MYYGFQTQDENAGIAALLVYGIYRSRDVKKLKVTPEFWSTIERAVKSSAKRALDLHDFIEKIKPKLMCQTVKPKWMTTNSKVLSMIQMPDGTIVQKEDRGRREFWVEILESIDHKPVLDILYGKTSWVISLVRDRLERERPLEISGLITQEEDEEDETHE